MEDQKKVGAVTGSNLHQWLSEQTGEKVNGFILLVDTENTFQVVYMVRMKRSADSPLKC